MPRLENWSLVDEPYSAPEENRIRLAGTVYDREGFQDGEKVITSRPKQVTEDDKVVTFTGSIYELGEVDPEYEKLYPNARERLLSSLKKLSKK